MKKLQERWNLVRFYKTELEYVLIRIMGIFNLLINIIIIINILMILLNKKKLSKL